ncbi:TraM recognition domain-containing protein [Actinoplanes sp. NPDC049599]|uniref:TraM recognition domain-containing protein n=1 Tax=Actinoplanes sp. NPDC049599 TaxID=3363903 RepID=UPI00378FD78A
MSTSGKADASVLRGDAKVIVEGLVHVGHLRDLVQQQTRRAVPVGGPFTVGLPESGLLNPFDIPVGPSASGVPMEKLEWTLRSAPGELYLRDAGLTAAYGLFGAPGSGKTTLLLKLLRQVLALHRDDPERRFGGLILDPKAALVEDVRAMAENAGRSADLVVISAEELARRQESVNLIDYGGDPRALGRLLVLAGQSAGAAASEQFWFGAWKNLFSPALQLLAAYGEEPVNLRTLVEHVLTVRPGADGQPERPIQALARRVALDVAENPDLPSEQRSDLQVAVDEIEGFYRQDAENVETVNALISGAYGDFRLARWRRFTEESGLGPAPHTARFHDRIIDDGKLVLVSVSPDDPAMAKTICTLTKVLFQQAVISRLGRVRAGTLRNFTRPVFLACDEYSGIASEVPGQPMGDGYFLSLCRQNGCLALIATQSVNMLQSGALKDVWKGVFSNFGATFFLRLSDRDTAEEATRLVGENDWLPTSLGASYQAGGGGYSSQRSLQEHKELPTTVLTQVLPRGFGVAVGSLDGNKTRPGATAFEVGPAGDRTGEVQC